MVEPMLLRLLTACLVATTLLPAHAATAAATDPKPVQSVEGITEYRLPNGLQVLLAPDDSKPTTTVNVTYRVGSRHESYGETGMAHLLEHLLFKGTPTHRNVWAEFTKRGLRANGSTWLDRTNYFASFAANDENLKWYLDWQADAMVNSFIARKDLDSEMTVVRNEMEMGENSPSRILFEKTLAAMYQWHNYGKTTIGARADVENVDIGRLQAFYRLYYQPDNATLIVSGKFDPAKVLGWVQGSFGKIPRSRQQRPQLYTLDPAQDGERSVTLRRVGGATLMMAGYHVPPGAHPDFAAVELLALILGDTPSGRIHKRLVEKGLAASAFSETLAMHDPGVGLWGVQLAPGQDVDKARDALLAVVEGLGSEPITADELKRAQAKWLKSWDLQYTNPEAVGVALSESIALGDWRLFFLLRDRVRDAKLADVQRVAQERLLQANRTLALYLPTEKPVRAPAPAMVDVAQQIKEFKPQAGVAAVAAFDPTPANIDARTQRFSLPSGLKAALLPKPSRGNTVRATLTLRYGDEKSLFGQGEVASMVASMLDRGTTQLSREQIQDRLDQLRSEVAIGGGAGAVSVNITSQRETIADTIALVGQLLRQPSFPASALDELQRQGITSVQQQRDDPQAIVANAVARHGNPYPRGDVRYARSFDEIVAEIKAVNVEQLKDFHRRFYGASNAQFGAVGDFDVATVRQALDQAFGDWKSPSPFARVPNPLYNPPASRLEFKTPDKQNAVLSVQQHVPLNDLDPDYPAFMLGNFMLGSGGDSRLWKRIREREGLSYSTYSYVSWNNFEPNSVWQGGAIFAPQNRDKVEQGFREEVARALKEGFMPEEVASAKTALLNFRRLSRAQDAQLAGSLSANLFLERTFAITQRVDEALAALTADQVNAVMRKHLQPQAFVIGVGGDFKQP
ncbi:M16 family metallopeptidase [Ideonella sp. BN130291]|uniref:M16 family metallopeptidase n=1 Tax=Ideonella sp. BN130291 TaxID=3112940 RepID=UPI002E26172F|nr:pitrilysin family protein [Ideonella sp. BN130291]